MKKNYSFNVCFGEGRWARGTVDVKASSIAEAEEKACEYIGRKLYLALPELDIEYTWELVEDTE